MPYRTYPYWNNRWIVWDNRWQMIVSTYLFVYFAISVQFEGEANRAYQKAHFPATMDGNYTLYTKLTDEQINFNQGCIVGLWIMTVLGAAGLRKRMATFLAFCISVFSIVQLFLTVVRGLKEGRHLFFETELEGWIFCAGLPWFWLYRT